MLHLLSCFAPMRRSMPYMKNTPLRRWRLLLPLWLLLHLARQNWHNAVSAVPLHSVLSIVQLQLKIFLT